MIQPGSTTLLAGLLFVSLSAHAAVKNAMRIRVLDSETHSVVLDDSGVPKNCDQVNYDAYCHSSNTTLVTNTLLVQEGDKPPFRVSCSVESKWSRCVPLEKGYSFDARLEKHGISIYYVDDQGKVRKQLYTFVTPAAATPLATRTPVAAASSAGPSATGQTAAPTAKKVQAPDTASSGTTQENVKCSFSSTPPGADITIDGRYVGSTPSVVSLGVGTHVVEVSLAGFAQWKRDLTVSPGSTITVNAILEKGK
jgi:hypothetical protein